MKKSLGPHAVLQPLPVVLIGSFDEEDRPNIMAAAGSGICSSRPPCVTACVRKATKTWHNVIHRKAFTIDIPSRWARKS